MGQAPTEKNYDVVVIGAGVIGMACAWRIAQQGLSVAVLDRTGPGGGASGVAAGMLAPATEADFGGQDLLALNLASAELWPVFDAELREASGGETGREQTGALTVAVDRDDAEELQRLHDFQLSLGLDARMLTRSECRELEPGLAPGIAAGVLTPGDGAVEPRSLLAALSVALDRAGGELIIGVDASIEVAGGRVTGVSTPAVGFRAGTVVLAAGSWSAEVPGLAGRGHTACAARQGPDPAAAHARRRAGLASHPDASLLRRAPKRGRGGGGRDDGGAAATAT